MTGDEKKAEAWQPASVDELAEAVRSAPGVIPVGAGTKPRLSEVGPQFRRVSTTRLRGIVDYEPSEFTFTARAGTPVGDIVAALAEKGQHLPFDPLLAAAGATLGGTVAAGLSGPGRFRFGGLRDFILGVRFVDGTGRLLTLGGRVVKNAAGFDLPKFFVGSAGRFGVLAEITFKVFPRAPATRTLRLTATGDAAKLGVLIAAARARWEIDALDTAPGSDAVWVRLAGPESALEPVAAEIFARWPGATLTEPEAREFWLGVGEFRWAEPGGTLIKVVLTPNQVQEFSAWIRAQSGGLGWVSGGGNVGYASFPPGAEPGTMPWPALTLRGRGPLWPGTKARYEAAAAVKKALDPDGRFPNLDA